MIKKIVFDFDRTLTYRDSLTILFLNEMKGMKKFYLVLYFLLKVLSKLKIIPIFKEKEVMLNLLFKSDIKKVEEACKQLKMTFSPVVNILRQSIDNNDEVIILSATLELYLKEVFKNMKVKIIGTTLKMSGNKISIEQHPFGIQKLNIMTNLGIKRIDEMYYDSASDEFLISICKEWNKVKKGIIIESHNCG